MFDPTKYPITIRIVSGHMTASSPEFGIYVSKRFDDIRQPDEIGSLVVDLMRKINEAGKKMILEKKEVPKPPSSPGLFENRTRDQTLSVKEAAHLLQLSQDTVRRLADHGALPSRQTPGGHRRFAAEDIRIYGEKMDRTIGDISRKMTANRG